MFDHWRKAANTDTNKTNYWNQDPSVAGKRPNPTLSFKGIKISV